MKKQGFKKSGLLEFKTLKSSFFQHHSNEVIGINRALITV